jgi:hypothetical protein
VPPLPRPLPDERIVVAVTVPDTLPAVVTIGDGAVVVRVTASPAVVCVVAGVVACLVAVTLVVTVTVVAVRVVRCVRGGAVDSRGAVLVLGASVSTTDAGSDARPIGWLKSKLAAQVTPAVSAMPPRPASVQSVVLRRIPTSYGAIG